MDATDIIIHPIRLWRVTRGIRQGVMAKDLGITPAYLWRIEMRRAEMSVSLATRIANKTGLSLDEILREKSVGGETAK